ncbi:N-6 DNA methylase [Desulfovibrio sp. OttesenSCG-928-F20]|nr:N-6 DNA methylase [Desulfovibrio sp. OttesenSCG-928-F20]
MKSAEKLVEEYLRDLKEIRASGAGQNEPSYYPALEKLLNGIGADLKPKVRCIINPKNQGAGLPDGGLFTSDQIPKRVTNDVDFTATKPSRGVLEAKAANIPVNATADGEQVSRYLKGYGQVLVTNFWDFLLVGRDASWKMTKLERFSLAENEQAFWNLANAPKKTASALAVPFTEYLFRVFLHAAPLTEPQDVARFLASYARQAKFKLDEREISALDSLRAALEETLGVSFRGEQAERFFRSTLIQTLFYGIFSAWVMWSKEHPPSERQGRFDWHMAAWTLHVPMIGALFHQIVNPSRIHSLDLEELLNWTTEALNRVDRVEFFNRFADGEAVQYFYEPFLAAFDPVLRKELGVWYTPPEIVQYMVERVDCALRTELGVADGLADENVYVLDPCCGTGAYLVEVLKRIAKTLAEKGADALTRNDIKRAAMNRVFGFEILPAPFVVSHLQLGLLLQSLGAPLNYGDDNERAAVYLTNALTGWEPQKEMPKSLLPELDDERDAADRIKQTVPILVVLGNPPYNAFAGVASKEERGMVNVYKDGLQKEWGVKKFNLDDLYIRFFRLAERRIAEKTGKGIICYISNSSFISEPSYVVMRKKFFSEFNSIFIDNLNGDSRETGKLTPDGKPDPSVFSTVHSKVGIKVGTAISLMVRDNKDSEHTVQFREFWGTNKRADLLNSQDVNNYEAANPEIFTKYILKPLIISKHYREWTKLNELCAVSPQNGLMEKRSGGLIDIEKAALTNRMKKYFDVSCNWETLVGLKTGLTEAATGYNPQEVRTKLLSKENFLPSRIIKYQVRPFDVRWCYYSGVNPLWNRSRPILFSQLFKGNSFLVSRPSGVANPEGSPFFCSTILGDNDLAKGHAYYIAFFQGKPKATHHMHLGETSFGKPNISQYGIDYIETLYRSKIVSMPELQQAAIWLHALAVGYSPAYLTDNADALRLDWPRIPLPQSKNNLEASAALGQRIAGLLDVDTPLSTPSQSAMQPILHNIGLITSVDSTPLEPDKGHLDLTAGWGHAGQGTSTMPGRGKFVERDYSPEEMDALLQGAEGLGQNIDRILARIGSTTYDIYLNDHALWKNIPKLAWNYYIGGYQVIKKWLSYREFDLLGRALMPEEARYVTDVARRLTALRLMEDELDANYRAIAG